MANSKRILPPKAKRENAEKLTHDQISEAIRQFQERGGLIRRLPPESSSRRDLIGHRWEGMYESLSDQ